MAGSVITIMGPIGAGKTVQAQMLAKALGWETFSTGQLVRDGNNEVTQAAMLAGKLAPTEHIQELVLAKIKSLDATHNIILDGSPRMLPEARRLDRELPALDRQLSLVIFLQVSEPTVEARLAQRGRPDDHPDIIKVRWQEYQRDTMPVVEHYRELGIVRDINGSADPETVTDSIIELLRSEYIA